MVFEAFGRTSIENSRQQLIARCIVRVQDCQHYKQKVYRVRVKFGMISKEQWKNNDEQCLLTFVLCFTL